MKRRALIHKIGAAGIATTAISGTSTARPSVANLGIDRELDVSSVSGSVTLDTIIEPRDRQRLPADVDPEQFTVAVAEDADVIALNHCCEVCCGSDPVVCPIGCNCCVCDFEC